MTTASAAIMLFLVMDPIGNSLLFTSILESVEKHRRTRVLVRELLVALGILLLFLFCGPYLLKILHIQEPALSIAGGIVLFLIAIRMVFPTGNGVWGQEHEGEPFIVPLATPLVAGPSAAATVLLMASSGSAQLAQWIVAVLIAWAGTALILVLSDRMTRLLGRRLVSGMEKLMGMILITIAVQMLLDALHRCFPP